MRVGRRRSLQVAGVLFLSGLLPSPLGAREPTATASAGALPEVVRPERGPDEDSYPLLRLLAYAPLGSEVVNYSNLAGLKRQIGAEITRLEDVPFPPVDRDAALSPQQIVGRAWWWDVGRQIPVSPFLGVDYLRTGDWETFFGFDLFKVDYELQVGEPPDLFTVVEGAIDPSVTGPKLTALGYSAQTSPFEADATLYSRFGDYEIRFDDPVTRRVLSRFNRVIVAPGRIVAGPTDALVKRVVDVAAGAAPSLATDPSYVVLASAMEDPALLSETTLLGATLLGRARSRLLAPDIDELVGQSRISPERKETPRQRLREELADESALPPYRLIGLGYRRGGTLAQRYWLFTMVYDDRKAAEEAAAVLGARIRRYHSLAVRRPLIGEYIADLLPPVIREYADGVTLSLLLREKEDRPAGWHRFYLQRDLAFLAPGRLT